MVDFDDNDSDFGAMPRGVRRDLRPGRGVAPGFKRAMAPAGRPMAERPRAPIGVVAVEGGGDRDAGFPLIMAGTIVVMAGTANTLKLQAKQPVNIRAIKVAVEDPGGACAVYLSTIKRGQVAILDASDLPLHLVEGPETVSGALPFSIVGFKRWFRLDRGNIVEVALENRGGTDALVSLVMECYAESYL